MKEADFRTNLCKKLRALGADVQTIETSTGSGVPDVNVCWHGVEFWIECKMIKKGKACYLRPQQLAWFTRRKRSGGLVFILAYATETQEILLWENVTDYKPSGAMVRILNTENRRILNKNFNMEFILG